MRGGSSEVNARTEPPSFSFLQLPCLTYYMHHPLLSMDYLNAAIVWWREIWKSNVTSLSSDSLMLTIPPVVFQPILYLHRPHSIRLVAKGGVSRRCVTSLWVSRSPAVGLDTRLRPTGTRLHSLRSGSEVCAAECNSYLPNPPGHGYTRATGARAARRKVGMWPRWHCPWGFLANFLAGWGTKLPHTLLLAV